MWPADQTSFCADGTPFSQMAFDILWNLQVLEGWTHWGQVTHICVNKLNIIGSDNGLSPGRRQAIIRTNAGILLIWP